MKLRTVAQWSLAIAVLIGVTWNSRETIRGLEAKIVYQRQLINELKADIRSMRQEWRDSVSELRRDLRAAKSREEASGK